MVDVIDGRIQVRKWGGNDTGSGPEFRHSTFHNVYVAEN